MIILHVAPTANDILLRSVLDWLIKRSFTPGQASRCKLRVYCDGFHWVNKTFTSARRARHPFVGTLVSLSSVRRSELGSGGEADRSRGRFMLCNSFIIAGLVDLSAFPGFVPSRFFSCPSLHVCLDVIPYIMTLFCSRLLASVESAIIWKHRDWLEHAIYF